MFSRDAARSFVPADAELLELFAKHAAIAITNARLHEAAEANARAEAVAAERNRMAREVHDAVAQGLVSILLQLRVGARARSRPADVEDASRRARPGARGRGGGVRGDAAERARPRALAARGAVARGGAEARARVGEPHRRRRRPARDLGHARSRCPPDLAHTLFRIAQEALTNALRHARARSVRVGIVYATRA